jgi:hypothetical protein
MAWIARAAVAACAVEGGCGRGKQKRGQGDRLLEACARGGASELEMARSGADGQHLGELRGWTRAAARHEHRWWAKLEGRSTGRLELDACVAGSQEEAAAL